MNLSDILAITTPIQVHPERCIHSFSPRATCQKCIQFCPSHSIDIKEGEISVESCNGCGQCVQACPHDVFEMDFPRAYALCNDSPLIIGCNKQDISDKPVLTTGCLQQFTWLQLALLASRFKEVVLFADSNLCSHCSCKWFPEGQLMLLERYGLQEHAKKICIIREKSSFESYLSEKFNNHNPRREYMKNQVNNIKNMAEKYTRQSVHGYLDAFRETLTTKSVLDFEKTQPHSLLLNELYAETAELNVSEKIPLQALSATRCRFCHICEKLCAWQALAIIEENGHAVLAHHDVLCARCGVCIDICPENSLLWNNGLTIKDITHPQWRILTEGNALVCQNCGEKFYPLTNDQNFCPICQNKTHRKK